MKYGLVVFFAAWLAPAAELEHVGIVKSTPIAWDFSHNRIPRYDGRLLQLDRDHTTIRWFDSAGKLERDAVLSRSDISASDVADVASAPDGTIAAAIRHSGSGAIAFLSRAAELQRLVKTGNFAAYHISFAPDGTLWAIGREESSPDSAIFRKYDSSGRLLGAFLPASEGPASFRGGADSILITARDRIGLYSAPGNEYVELHSDGRIANRQKLSSLGHGAYVTGMAFGASGGLYISSGPVARLFRVEESSGKLSPVDTSALGASWPVILGSDETGLVVYTKPATLSWLSLP